MYGVVNKDIFIKSKLIHMNLSTFLCLFFCPSIFLFILGKNCAMFGATACLPPGLESSVSFFHDFSFR